MTIIEASKEDALQRADERGGARASTQRATRSEGSLPATPIDRPATSPDKCRAWRVVLVDDHPLIRDAYRAVLEAQQDLTVLACLEDSATLTTVLRTMSVDVLLLDYRLADDQSDGVQLIQRLSCRFPSTRVLVCSASDDITTRSAAMLAGAQGFLSKAAPLTECVRAVRAVASGGRYWEAQALPVEAIDTGGPLSSLALPAELTMKEFDVLRCCQQGLTPTSIAEKFKRSVKTVSGHKVAAYRKRGFDSDAAMFAQKGRSPSD